MSNLLAARMQMGVSLGFHIVFAAIGIAMPFLMAISHYLWLRSHEKAYLSITQAWSKGVAIFFATGAVSGTVLSFELGLLWPKFMLHAGPIIGMPFSWEGTAFFLEAIAIGIFLYGWNRIPKWIHWGSGLFVGISGVLSGIFVICANAWMNSPAGFVWDGVQASQVDPWAAMFNKAAFSQSLHMTLAAFTATGFGVAGLHAIALLKYPKNDFHKKAYRIALTVGAIAALLQPLSGDISARDVAQRQPLKLAAMESHFKTTRGASLLIGGFPDENTQTVSWGLHIPQLLSFLAFHDLNAEVKGLEAFPRENWPPIVIVHFAFQIMVGLGTLLATLGGASFLCRRWIHHPSFLKLVALCTPFGFLAIESGWVVTEVGRQPWIIYEVMKTRDAVTPMPGLVYPASFFTLIYILLSFIVVWLMYRQFKSVNTSHS